MIRVGLEFRHTDLKGGGTFVYFLNLERHLQALGLQTSRIYLPQSVAPSGLRHYVDRTLALAARKRHIRRAAHGIDIFASPFPEWQRLKGVARSFHSQDVAFLKTAGYKRILARYWKHQIARILDDYEHVVAISHATKADLVELFGPSASRATVIHHGIGAEFHAVAQPRPSPPSDRIRLLWVGNHHPRKRLGYAIEIANALARIRPCDLLVVGNFPSDVAELTADLHRGCSISRKSGLSISELIECYRDADALLWTSAYEGFGFPLVEAAACFCPIFAVDNSSVSEVLGGNFVTLPSQDATSAAEMLLACTRVDAGTVTMVEAAKNFSRQFTWDNAARRTAALWAGK